MIIGDETKELRLCFKFQTRHLFRSLSCSPFIGVAGVRWSCSGALNPVTKLTEEEEMMRETGPTFHPPYAVV